MKKRYLILAAVLACGTLSGCEKAEEKPAEKVELTVITPYSASDGNRKNFVDAYKAY